MYGEVATGVVWVRGERYRERALRPSESARAGLGLLRTGLRGMKSKRASEGEVSTFALPLDPYIYLYNISTDMYIYIAPYIHIYSYT